MFKSVDQFVSKDYSTVADYSSKKLAEIKEKMKASKLNKLSKQLSKLDTTESQIVMDKVVEIATASVVEEAAAVVQ